MDTKEAITLRHSVRAYAVKHIEEDAVTELLAEISAANRESGLNIQLVLNDPAAFSGLAAKYGSFTSVQNYIAIVGPSDAGFKMGYYGEKIVLKAQTLGLNTCWVGGTFKRSSAKKKVKIAKGEVLKLVIAIGYGLNEGKPHKSKPMKSLCSTDCEMPVWFREGMEAAMLAPTALNQQKFYFTLLEDKVYGNSQPAFFGSIDLGIATYHFEIGSGRKVLI